MKKQNAVSVMPKTVG